MVADVTVAGTPDREEHDILGMILSVLFGRFRPCLWSGEPLCDMYRKPLLSPNTLSKEDFLKIERSVADVTSVGFPDRAERAILEMILDVGQFRPHLWPGSYFVMWEPLLGP